MMGKFAYYLGAMKKNLEYEYPPVGFSRKVLTIKSKCRKVLLSLKTYTKQK